jgi:Uma2 family endonuclease
VPCVWVIDPDARSVEAYVLRSGAYVLQTQAVGHESLRAEPIPDLAISIATLWT